MIRNAQIEFGPPYYCKVSLLMKSSLMLTLITIIRSRIGSSCCFDLTKLG